MCEDAYFQLRMSKKQLDRLSKKAEKEQKQQEAKVGGKLSLSHAKCQERFTITRLVPPISIDLDAMERDDLSC